MLEHLEMGAVERTVGGEFFGIGTATREDGSRFLYEPSYTQPGTMITYEFSTSGNFGGSVGGSVSGQLKDGKVVVNSDKQEVNIPRLNFSQNIRSETDVAKELWRIGEHATY